MQTNEAALTGESVPVEKDTAPLEKEDVGSVTVRTWASWAHSHYRSWPWCCGSYWDEHRAW